MRQEIRAVRSLAARGALALAVAPSLAHASFLSGDALDTAANVLSWFIICVVPLAVLGLFWYVHILPEVIAEKRHHPQKDSIKVLCILSLFFGGLLWPFAWLWAYTRPVAFRAAYGVEKHEDYFHEMGEKARRGELPMEDIAHLRSELEAMARKGALPPALRTLLEDMDAILAAPAPPAAPVVRATRVAETAKEAD
jgi:hypothetical protein